MKPALLKIFDNEVIVRRLADTRLMMVFMRGETGAQEIASRVSTDNGKTWSDAATLTRLPNTAGAFLGTQLEQDKKGELHILTLNNAAGELILNGEGERASGAALTEKRLDIWHAKSSDGMKSWTRPRMIWKGFTGSMNSFIVLKNRRIIFPFSYFSPRHWKTYRGDGLENFTFMGQWNCSAIYSDDEGENWSLSNAIRVPVPDIVSAYGAVEPVIIQLKDGKIWMLIRTQMGRFWESFSDDGSVWSAPRPTTIVSSDSPAGLVRLDDGRIVLFWNNCQRFPYAFGGRHVIHAAISSDEGKSWRGFREVARDPRRDEPPPPTGDFGAAYPLPETANNGKVIYSTGQGKGRVQLMLLDPEWLLETTSRADFDLFPDEWSIFGTRGVSIIEHPRKADKKILKLQKVDEDWPAVAAWNFPAGRRGQMTIRFMLEPGCADARVGVTDHFSSPFDFEDHFYNLLNLNIKADCRLSDVEARADGWRELVLRWNDAARSCDIFLDKRSLGSRALLRKSPGANYLRLGFPTGKPARGAMLVESVEVDIANDEEKDVARQ